MKLSDIFSNYDTVRQEMREAVSGMTQEQLDWRTEMHPWSVGDILRHIVETEAWWVECVALGRDWCDEDEEPFREARTLDQIFEILDRYFDVTWKWLDSETSDDWDEKFYLIKEVGEKVSKRWLSWHVVEHQARHRGQVFMLMHMQGLEVPSV